jgi:hypothetical protein
LDSKMEAMRAHFARERELEGPWTSYNPSLGRPLLDSEKFMRPEKAPESQPAVASAEPAAPAAAPGNEQSASPAPAPLDLFSEQKA